jgi:hypothetical protein
MYDFLFGGFDTLANCDDDDNEDDELDSIPVHRKTKDGYLKDGFVVDSSSGDDDDDDEENDEEEEEETDEDEEEDDKDEEEDEACEYDADPDMVASGPNHKPNSNSKIKQCKRREKKQPKEEVLVDTSSELSEEAYEYFDD